MRHDPAVVELMNAPHSHGLSTLGTPGEAERGVDLAELDRVEMIRSETPLP